jgi:heat-inducible transcriptional repressor
MPPIDRMELDARKQRILQVIVQDYVATGEPVGSHVLMNRYALGCKSATIRSEMAEMSEQGFLRQPHTSAGRVPSDQGYRFYVNRLMPLPVLQEGEASAVRAVVRAASSELDLILRKTCQLLATMTRLPAVATAPDKDDTELRQIFVSPAGTDKLLLVLLFSTGRTENRLVSDAPVTASDALALANALNERFSGKTLSALRGLSASAQTVPVALHAASQADRWTALTRELIEAVRALADETPLYVEGAHEVFQMPEFRDVERLSQFLGTLQERAALVELMGRALIQRGEETEAANSGSGSGNVQVVIGEENARPVLHPYSVVSAPYYVGSALRGTIGVLGPTRMDYARTSAAVAFMAETVGDLLTRLSLSG